MKALHLLVGALLFTSMVSACAGQNQVSVLCSTDWFIVTVHPFLLNNDVYVHFYEVHLGLGCPANHVYPHFYQFSYRVTECGIRVKAITQDVVIYSSEIHYATKGSSIRYVIPVSCAAPQRSPWLTKPYATSTASSNVAVSQKSDTCYEVFSLSHSSQRSNCSCPPCVFKQAHT
uniref:placenta-specific protein 1 n=1 Tax=Jaculus jaculus TaxID=51337 RepID=UPI000333093D|nr:placenta-specific protein 1 [Jaculus jaculus]XP_044996478.1 placenta-specific protein 1 [Jaculus jaculus]